MLINALNIKWPFTLNTRTKFNTHLMHILAAFTLEFGLRQCELNTHWTNPPLEVDWNRIGTEFIVFSLNDNKIMHSYAPPPMGSNMSNFSLHRPQYMLYLLSKILWWPIMPGRYWLDAAKKETAYTKWSRWHSCSTSSTTSNKVWETIKQTFVCFDTSRMLAQ